MSVNAQETGYVDTDGLGLSSDAIEVTAGTTLASSDNVTMKLAYTENIKTSSLYGSSDAAQGIMIGGVQYELPTGITGSANPQTVGITTAPTTGMVIQFDVKKDGYLYVFGKMSSNKAYYVWEGTAETQPGLVGYDFKMRPASEIGGSTVIYYTLPGDDEYGYYTVDLDPELVYSDGSSLRWPEVIWTKDQSSAVKVNGLGVISFPVYAEAGTYLVHAQGSKITTDGFVFSETALGDVTFVESDPSGISNVTVNNAEDANAPYYNLQGQRVNKDAKGILIQNGKKFINK
ncbi:MAG: hypothetical protein Q4D41_10055 [Prevotellaceae bacterium]|nr:hypothetical protein [Prevotellaceae bacterium]